MGIDILARSLAAGAKSRADLALAAGAPATVFTGLSTATVDPQIKVLSSTGYSADGVGRGTYVADALATAALAAAHPRFCRATANGRYFRLVSDASGEISTAQGGATGITGQNDQPAVQAAVAYAAAVGIPAVRMLKAHESWQPAFPGGTPDPLLGFHLTVTGDVALLGAPGGTTILLKNPTGGARAKTDGTGAWACGWLIYRGAGVTRSILRDITVEGGLTFANVQSNTESNTADKGVAMFDNLAPITRIDHRNVTLRNFAGEIWYMGGTFAGAEVYVENLTLTGSPQSAWNAGTLAKVVAVNLQAGDTYQPAETISGAGHLYLGGRFFNGYSMMFIATEAFDSNYFYNYPILTNASPGFTTFEGTVFEKINNPLLTSRVRGRLVLLDTTLQFVNTGKLCDIDLDIEAWGLTALVGGAAIVNLPGTSSLTDQVSGAPAGTYYQKPRDIRIAVTVRRADKSNGVAAYSRAFRLSGKLFDVQSIALSACDSGDAVAAVTDVMGWLTAGATLPRITWDETCGMKEGQTSADPAADFTVETGHTHITVNPQDVGPYTMTLANSGGYTFADGQRMRVRNIVGNIGRKVRMPASGHGYTLGETRILTGVNDYVDLAWSAQQGAWVEVGYRSSFVPVLAGSKTWDAPSIANGAQATTTVTVTGAVLGDFVDRISLGVSAAALQLTGYVSSADTVTVVAKNDTGGTVDLASTTLRVEVRRAV